MNNNQEKQEVDVDFETLLRAMGEDDNTKNKIEEMNAAWDDEDDEYHPFLI